MSFACLNMGDSAAKPQVAAKPFFPSYSITRQIRFIFYSLRCKRFCATSHIFAAALLLDGMGEHQGVLVRGPR